MGDSATMRGAQSVGLLLLLVAGISALEPRVEVLVELGETSAAHSSTAAAATTGPNGGGGHFNFFGFFGCCYHCKHSPECTQKCMSKHNIPNGSGEADPDLPVESVELLQITDDIEPLDKQILGDLNDKAPPMSTEHNEKKSEKQEVAACIFQLCVWMPARNQMLKNMP